MRRLAVLGAVLIGGCAIPGPRYTDVTVDPTDATLDVGLGPRWFYGHASPARLDLIEMVVGNYGLLHSGLPIDVVARRPGYKAAARQFLFKDRPAEIHFRLEPLPATAGGAAPGGMLEVVGVAGDRVYLNGKELGALPLAPLSEEPGEYLLEVERRDGTRHQQAVRLTEGGSLRIAVPER